MLLRKYIYIIKRERNTKDKERAIEYFLMKSRWKLVKYNEINDNLNESITVPLLPFNININLDDNLYKPSEIKPSHDNQQVNVDYIKIQLVLKISKHKISTQKLIDDIRQIDKDITRTSYLSEIEKDKSLDHLVRNRIKDSLRNILITFAAFNQNLNQNGQESNSLGYTQGYFE